ncbi:MAG TPA: ABC transporter ATP-binding protein [Actinomycetota bacterium]|nr:ABC transporter ATP-binding protein [Actinomycetota bacterium]
MKRERSDTTRVLLRYIGPHRGRVALLALFLLLSMGLPLAGPQILRVFIDTALDAGEMEVLIRLALLYLAIGLVAEVIAVVTTYMAEQVGWTATNDLRSDLTEHALGLDVAYHNSHTPGEMIERIDGDVSALSNFFSVFVLYILGSAIFGLGILVLVAREHLGVGAVLAAFAAVSVSVMHRLRRIAVPASTAQREASAELFGFLEERLSGTDDIRSLGAGHHVMRGFARANRLLHRRLVHSEKVGVLIWTASTVLFGVSIAMTLALGGWLFARGQATPGTIFMLFQYVMMLDQPIMNIASQMREFQKAGAGLNRIGDLLAERPTIVDGSAPLPDGALSVELDGVTFAYADDDVTVLDDVSLRVSPGEVVGVLGRTGSGKTTLTRLLLRLYDVGQGSVRVGGHDMRELSLDDLRRRVGVVTQDVQLFQGSVRDNLTLFDGSITDEAIVDALRTLGLGAWLEGLPDGLDTELASQGGGLSAGQAQLLAFARVFLRDPGLVILDEASSRLDPATEAMIESAVDRLLVGRTAVIVAHRLATLGRADTIVVMEHGRVLEHGPRAELASDPGSRFARLLRTGIEEVLA